MFVRASGPESAGPALVFVHGLGESGLCFEAIVGYEGLSSFRCLIPDLPGYGRSKWPSSPLSLQGCAELLLRWLETRGEREAIVVGHSMGGVIALLMAERAPSLVSRLINVDGNMCLHDCAYSGRAARQPLEEYLQPFGGFSKLSDEIYRGGVDDDALRGYYVALRLADPRTYHAHSLELVDLSRDERLAVRFAALPQPKVYLAGVPNGASARSLELLDEVGVGWRGIEPSGHWPFIDQPKVFAAEVKRFVTPQ